MIVEILQLYSILIGRSLYYLPLHMMIFVLLPLIVRYLKAREYRCLKFCTTREKFKISVVIPEFNEDPVIFEECLRSVARCKPDEIVVVFDDGREIIADIARKYNAKVIRRDKRGKRSALVTGWEMAIGDIIVHVDSDTILEEGAIDEIIKPFSDELVVGVQGKILVRESGSKFSTKMSEVMEINRDFNNKALNGCLVVIDGRFNAWRRDFLLSLKEEFLNEKFLGASCEIGDDRFLTQMANLKGFKTVYRDTAVAYTLAPHSFKSFVKQQLRWARSGYKALFKDIRLRLIFKVSLTYNILQFTYYFGSLSFTLAIIHDILFCPPIIRLPPIAILPIAIIGSGLIAFIRRLAVGMYKMTPKEFLTVGATSLFIFYPMMIYALMTVRNQNAWLTRTAS